MDTNIPSQVTEPSSPTESSPEKIEVSTPKKPNTAPMVVLVLLAIVVLVGAGFYFFKRSNSSSGSKAEVASVPVSTTAPVPVHALIGSPTAPTKLIYAIHWTEAFQTDGIIANGQVKSKGLKQYLEEYVALHPDVSFQIQVYNYNDYAAKLQLAADAGIAPDIYQIYAPWGVSYVDKGVLDEPPADVVKDIQKNYVSYKGATIKGKVWGYPTEIDTYTLLYNKSIFKEAGISKPPTTFDELVTDAVKTTKLDDKGNISRYGIAFLKGNDWEVVDPFLSWLFSDNGSYLSTDLTKSLFNSPQGNEVLSGELRLFKQKATDNNGNFFDFKDSKVAMVVSPPWTKALLQAGFGDKFNSAVGIVPLPYFKKQAALQYSWFMGVTAGSKNKQATWDFLKWFNSDVQPATKTTRYGDLLANTIGAIPSRKIDLANHQSVLKDPFMKMFVDQIPNSISEPNVANAASIKKAIMAQIESAWAGDKTAAQALDTAAKDVDALLQAK